MKSPLLWLFLIVLAFPAESRARPGASPTDSAAWLAIARRFTGESDSARERAIKQLRKLPNLESQLREELARPNSPNRFLAFDVIANLGLTSLLPELTRAAREDTSGYTIHALNILLNDQNRAEFTALYRELVAKPAQAPATTIALLDTLARLASPLEPPFLETLLASGAPEVRSAALYYVRHFAIRLQQWEYLPLARIALQRGSLPLKMQALHLLSEVPASSRAGRRAVEELLPVCEKDPSPEVKTACGKLRQHQPLISVEEDRS